MIAKIIVASIIGIISIVGLILAFKEVVKEHSAADDKIFFWNNDCGINNIIDYNNYLVCIYHLEN